MNLDALLKKYFSVCVCGCISAAAYFQASGVGSIVVGTMASVADGSATAPPHHAHVVAPPQGTAKSADVILSRNAFDSATGPLDGKVIVPSDGGGALPPVANGNDPYQDPPCSGVRVSLVTASDDPDWSFASLSRDGKSELRRKGDKVGEAQIVNIGWYPDAKEPTPHVWMNEGGTRCLVAWGAAVPAAAKTPPVPTAAPSSGVPPALDAKIHKKSDTEFDVERSAVGEIIKNYAQLASGLHARTTKDGVRLSGIKSSSILNTLGMKNGDVLKSINGYDMSDQDKALEAYAKLKSAKSLTIEMDRGGSPMTIGIGIQ